MLKKLCLLLSLATMSLFPRVITQPTHQANILEHIISTRKDIMLEMQLALIVNQKARKHFQESLLNDYETIQELCMDTLNTIIISPEFATTIEQVTDEQIDLIINQMVQYNDIIIDPSAHPLEQKIKNELSLAHFDEKTEQLFNVFYVVFATIYGGKMLLEKLAIKEKQLLAELEPQASNQSITA